MIDFLWAGLLSLLLVLACTVIFYEILAQVWLQLPRLQGQPRRQILLTVLATFFGHTVAIWIFGLSYYGLDKGLHTGTLQGNTLTEGFIQYIYFSCVTYSSLGLGDIYPTGMLQLLMGVEGILGLVLIGWSVTFTYLVTQQYLLHRGGADHPLVRK